MSIYLLWLGKWSISLLNTTIHVCNHYLIQYSLAPTMSLKLSVCLACSMNFSLCDTLTQYFNTGSLYKWQGPWDEAMINILQTHTVVGCLSLSFSSLAVRKDGKADRGWETWEQIKGIFHTNSTWTICCIPQHQVNIQPPICGFKRWNFISG